MTYEIEAIRAWIAANQNRFDTGRSDFGDGEIAFDFCVTLLRLLDAAREELDAEQVSHLKTRVRLTRIREAASDPVLIDSVEELAERFVDYGNMHGVFAVDNAHVLPSTYHYFEAGIDDDTGNVGETYCVEITKDEYNGARAANAIGWFAKKAKWHTDRLASALKEPKT